MEGFRDTVTDLFSKHPIASTAVFVSASVGLVAALVTRKRSDKSKAQQAQSIDGYVAPSNVECFVERRFVGNLPAELIWARPQTSSSKAETLVVVVPGLPGVGQVYSDFISTIASCSGCPVVCVTWCGHHATPRPDSTLDLEAQSIFITAALHDLRATPNIAKLVLVGHSLGTWLACQALESFDVADKSGGKGLPVVAVHLYCPILANVTSIPKVRKLMHAALAVHRLKLGVLVRAIAWPIPTEAGALLMQILWWLAGRTTMSLKERWLFRAALKHVQSGAYSRAIAVALGTLELIGEPGSWMESLRVRGSAVALHFAVGDAWTPAEIQEGLSSPDMLPATRTLSHKMPHAMVTHQIVAREVATMLAEDVLQAAQ